jgi:16S rRNA (uracil1498-N3)-methyltransferase
MASRSVQHKSSAMTRIYIDSELAVGEEIELPTAARRHVVQVLRLSEGASITLFNGRGGEYQGVITSQNRRAVSVTLEKFSEIERESPLEITLVQGISRGERMDYTIQKAVELGIHRIVPFKSLRTGVRLPPDRIERRLEHWRGVIHHACEQCGRNRVPSLSSIQSLDEILAAESFSLGAVLNPNGMVDISQLEPAPGPILLVIGPEGGLDDAEIEQLREAGFLNLRLGPRVLRTETAAVTALSILQANLGDLRN